MAKSMKVVDVKEFILEYENCMRLLGVADQTGDFSEIEKECEGMYKKMKFIHVNDLHENGFLKLLEHKDESVRYDAASRALFFDNKLSVRVLKKLAKGRGIASFNASITLKQWNEGNLKSAFQTGTSDFKAMY